MHVLSYEYENESDHQDANQTQRCKGGTTEIWTEPPLGRRMALNNIRALI
jgi:hypothetical protein